MKRLVPSLQLTAMLAWLAMLLGWNVPVGAAPPSVDLAALVAELQSDDFDRRDDALRRLQQTCDDPQLKPQLMALLRSQLQAPADSPETRLLLAPLLKRLELALPIRAPQPTEIDAALHAIDDDRFEHRVAATQQIELWLQHGQAVGPLFARLKQRQNDTTNEVSREARARLQRLAELARSAWLDAPAERWPLAPLSDVELQQRMTTLGSTLAADQSRIDAASQDLLDQLAQPAHTERVLRVIEARLADENAPQEVVTRLKHLQQWTKPAMVAEIWSQQSNITIQHLLIDVPAQVDGAPNPTHFDRIDDRRAHCVSGNSLTLGDWPVGVFFPSPRAPDGNTQFFLFNLSTTRARLAYEQWTLRPEHERLRELTRRSVARWLEERRAFTLAETLMLRNLEVGTVLDFIPRYLRTVDDAPLDGEAGLPELLKSKHSLLCLTLCGYGNSTVGRALADPAVLRRIDSTGGLWPRLALVAIGYLDAWPELDTALAEIVADENIPAEVLEQIDIRATAAALLLRRHKRSSASFDLDDDAAQMAELRGALHQVLWQGRIMGGGRVITGAASIGIDRHEQLLFKFRHSTSRRRVLQWWASTRPTSP